MEGSLATGTFELTQTYLQKIIVSVVILLVGLAIGILVKKLLGKILQEIGLNKIMSKVGVTVNLEKGVSTIISYVIYLIVIVLFLNQLGITSIVLYLVVGAILTLVILTCIVGLKDVIPNFVAWILLQKKGKLKVGKKVDVKEIYGQIEKIGYLETEIKTEEGDLLYVPNILFLKSTFKIKKP